MKEVGLAQKYADVLTTQEITGRRLAELTKEDLMSVGLPFGPARDLAAAAARLFWRCKAIHGVVLAPVDDRRSKIDTEGESHFVVLRGNDARYHLGGLDQIFRHMS